MLYHINHWNPKAGMSTCGFSIELYPEWKNQIAKSDLTQEKIDNVVSKLSELWLTNHGYNFELHKYGAIRVSWGEWGMEHITVIGNACGLDICNGNFEENKELQPHNVDSLKQASLILTIFLWLADYIVLQIKLNKDT